jgi:membrane-associated HD superfamily phosphohydrolase
MNGLKKIDFDSLTQEEKDQYKINITEEEIERQFIEQAEPFMIKLLEINFKENELEGDALQERYNRVRVELMNKFKLSKMSSSQIIEKSIAAAKEWAKKQLRERWEQEGQGRN